MRAAAIALAVTAAGCNALFGLDPTSLRDDAGDDVVDGAAGADAPLGWDTVTQVEVASTDADDDDPAMGPGGLELYWSVTVSGVPKDIVRSTRNADDEEFVVFQSVIDLNSAGTDATVRISPDASTLYMSSDRVAQGNLEIYTAARIGPSWTDVAPLGEPYSSALGNDHGAAPCLASQHMFVATDRDDDDYDIIEISEAGTSFAIASEADEISPFATEDCLTLYFAADLGEGNQDIYVVRREDLDGAWSEPVRVDDLSSGANDQDPWISADGQTALIASDRAGTWDIWRATR